WLAPDEPWPSCGNCGQPMPLLLQLNLRDLPTTVGHRFGTGMVQVFFCWNTRPHCEVEAEAWRPQSIVSKLVRLVEPIDGWRKPATTWTSGTRKIVQGDAPGEEPPIRIEDPITPTCLTNWEEDIDYPTDRDAAAMGVPDFAAHLEQSGVGEDWEY